jgi:hypothetical protein
MTDELCQEEIDGGLKSDAALASSGMFTSVRGGSHARTASVIRIGPPPDLLQTLRTSAGWTSSSDVMLILYLCKFLLLLLSSRPGSFLSYS